MVFFAYPPLMTTTKKTPRRGCTRVKSGHRRNPRLTGNRLRLAALIRLFDIPMRDMARCSGYSRCYLQRCITAGDSLEGSAEFYLRLEQALLNIIARRRRAFFDVPATDAVDAGAVLRSLDTRAGSQLAA